jgi:4-amino-4-deoxy-L-arabinose transferase-like glycosyltransferase
LKHASLPQRLLLLLAAIFAVQLVLIGLYPILDKSEARYALVVWRMVETGNWVTPSIDGVMPFWSKPPLGFWLSALAMKMFGVNEFAARLPGLLMTMAMAGLVVDFGRRMRDLAFGLTAGLVFASIGLVFVLSGQLLTDPVLVFGITLTMIAFWQVMTTDSRIAGYVVFVGLAITLLSKGLLGIVFAGGACLIWVLLQGRFIDVFRRLPVLTGTLLMLALAAPWYLLAEHRTPGFLNYFIIGEHFQRFLQPGWTGDLYGAGRKQFPGAIWLFLLVGALPWSGVMIGALLQSSKRRRLMPAGALSDPWIRYLLAWMLVPLLFYSLTRNLVLYYALPALPPLALLMAQALRNFGDSVHRWTVPGWAMVMPAIAIALVAYVNVKPDARALPTQKHIVTAWQQQRSPGDDTLVYLFDMPFSASFYSGDRAGLALDANAKATMVNQRFLAVSARAIGQIPSDVMTQFEWVRQSNNTILFRRLPP